MAYQSYVSSIFEDILNIRRIISQFVQFFETPAFTFQITDCFQFGAKNAVLDPGLRGFADVRDLTDVRCFFFKAL